MGYTVPPSFSRFRIRMSLVVHGSKSSDYPSTPASGDHPSSGTCCAHPLVPHMHSDVERVAHATPGSSHARSEQQDLMATSVDDYIALAGQLIDSASARATARHRLHAGARAIFEARQAIHEWQRVLLQAARCRVAFFSRCSYPVYISVRRGRIPLDTNSTLVLQNVLLMKIFVHRSCPTNL